MGKLFFILCTMLCGLNAGAADSVTVDGTTYQLSSPSRVVMSPGDVRKIDERCITKLVGLNKTVTCTAKNTVTATVSDVVVTDGTPSSEISQRGEFVFVAIAVVLMLFAAACLYYNLIVLAVVVANIVVVSTLGLFAISFEFIAPNTVFRSVTFVASLAALIATTAIIGDGTPKRKWFLVSASAHILLMLLSAALIW